MWLIFMVTLVALNLLVFKPTLELIDARKKNTGGLKKEGDSLSDETRRLLTQFEEQIALARAGAAKEREKIILAARQKEQAIIQEARKVNEDTMEKMAAQIQQEKKEAELKLRQYAQEMARAMAEKILERKVA